MKIQTQGIPLPVDTALVELLETDLVIAGVPFPVTLNFRDPSYSVDRGGFHPVEIAFDPAGCIQYITDFAYVGLGPYAELAKELDFDFSLGLFQHFGYEFPISEGAEMFAIWQKNFVSYYRMGVFQVQVIGG